jgi:hypothetical protein
VGLADSAHPTFAVCRHTGVSKQIAHQRLPAKKRLKLRPELLVRSQQTLAIDRLAAVDTGKHISEKRGKRGVVVGGHRVA